MINTQEIKDEGRYLTSTLVITFLFTAVLWIVWSSDMLLHLDLPQYGIIPRTKIGLRGIIFSPFIHDNRNVMHILSNTPPFMVLFFVLLNAYRKIAIPVLILIHLLTGCLVWLFAPSDTVHVGISGVIYGLAGFLVGSGLFRRNILALTVAILVIFFYGGMVVGFKPAPGLSWESHVCGAVVGLFLSFNFRNYGRAPLPSKPIEEPEDTRHFFEKHP
jgi:membrane associated rhomboid family serine protease